jgi:hypothetical protein
MDSDICKVTCYICFCETDRDIRKVTCCICFDEFIVQNKLKFQLRGDVDC